MSYEASLKHKRDAESVYNSAMRAGEAIGEARGEARGARKNAIAIAIEMKKDGLSLEQISRFTKLSIEEIEKL